MNNQDRKELEKAIHLIGEANEIIQSIRDEEESKYDNMPQGLQDSEKGEKMQENISALDDAISQLDEAVENINTATS